MWIVGEDVRDGQRLAFPLYTAALTFDMKAFRDNVCEENEKARLAGEAEVASVRARLAEHRATLGSRSADGFNVSADDAVARLEAELLQKEGDRKKRLQVVLQAEALVFFNGQHWPVRSIVTATSWDTMRALTAREVPVDTTNLPPLR